MGAAVAALVVVAAGLAAVHVGRAVDGVIRDVSARVQVARAATVDTGRARPAVPGAPIQPGGTGRGLVFDDPRVDVSRVDVRP